MLPLIQKLESKPRGFSFDGMSHPLESSLSNRGVWLLCFGPYLFVGIARRKDHILCREAPLSHPDAGSLKVLEHKTPRICGEQGSRDVVLMQNLAYLSTRSGEYRLGHRASLSL